VKSKPKKNLKNIKKRNKQPLYIISGIILLLLIVIGTYLFSQNENSLAGQAIKNQGRSGNTLIQIKELQPCLEGEEGKIIGKRLCTGIGTIRFKLASEGLEKTKSYLGSWKNQNQFIQNAGIGYVSIYNYNEDLSYFQTSPSTASYKEGLSNYFYRGTFYIFVSNLNKNPYSGNDYLCAMNNILTNCPPTSRGTFSISFKDLNEGLFYLENGPNKYLGRTKYTGVGAFSEISFVDDPKNAMVFKLEDDSIICSTGEEKSYDTNDKTYYCYENSWHDVAKPPLTPKPDTITPLLNKRSTRTSR